MQFNASTRVHEDHIPTTTGFTIFILFRRKIMKYNVTNLLCKSTKVVWQGNK